MSTDDYKKSLSDAVKASVSSSGALANLKQVTHDNAQQPENESLQDLKQQAVAAIENIQQLLNGGGLDDGTSQKLTAALFKPKAALGKGSVSRDALATALSDAVTAMGSSEGTGKGMSARQKADESWKKVESYNQEIDDDFTKMQKAGIVFNQSLLDRHKELKEYMETHPHDIAKQ